MTRGSGPRSAAPGSSVAPIDLLQNAVARSKWKGIAPALDEREMLARLQAAFSGGMCAGYTIERCSPGSVTYSPEGDRCHLTYELSLRNGAGEPGPKVLAAVRLFPSARACEEYRRTRLAPLASRLAGRPAVFPFSSPIAVVEALHMIVSIFPVDGELPTLVDATDPRPMTRVFRPLFPAVIVDGCRVEVCQYRRRNRCVLRYHVDVRRPGGDAVETAVVYGKVHARGRSALAVEAVEALREHALRGGMSYRFHIPRPLGVHAELQLALLEAIPGRRRITRLLKRRLRGAPESTPSLEDSLDACDRIAAQLHGSEISLGSHRTLEDDLSGLRRTVSALRPMSSELADLLTGWHDRVERDASGSKPQRPCFSHGDFKPGQVLFDGEDAGLVDFDTVCQAEPARDLGHFLAYVRMSILKEHGGASLPLAEELDRRFLDTYVTASGDRRKEGARLRTRVLLHQASALLHLAVKSWGKFKRERLERAITLLEEVSAASEDSR